MNPSVSNRDLALLHAIDDGRVECSSPGEPDFFVDGLACCDHFRARTLIKEGLIQPAMTQQRGKRPVELTSAGRAALTTS